MDTQVSHEISMFYGWWQLSGCLFAFLSLMSIWYHIGKKQHDYGPVWLALSVLCWAFSGLTEIVFNNTPAYSHYKDGLTSMLSLTNSLFILMALPWFKYLPAPFTPLIKSKLWPLIIGIPFAFALFPTLFKMFLVREAYVINELDVVYALLTLIFLGFVLWESFIKRRLLLLGGLALITILVTLMAQIYKLMDNNINLLLFSAIFKTSLIMLFFALALSWVKELTETLIPDPFQLKIKFIKKKTQKSTTMANSVSLIGFPGDKDRIVQLTPALYRLFKEFAQRKKDMTDGWLEIKPKNFDVAKDYDISDHNELKRLLEAILNGLFGKKNWTKDKHYEPLKATLFEMSENRERKIRLRIPKENIHIDY